VSLKTLKDKTYFILRHYPKQLFIEGKKLILNKTHCPVKNLSDGDSEMILISLSYLYVLYLPWQNTPLFKNLCEYMLMSTYEYSQKGASYLTEGFHKLFVKTPPVFQSQEKDFWKFIFLQIMVTKKETNIVQLLGFGPKFLQYLKIFVQEEFSQDIVVFSRHQALIHEALWDLKEVLTQGKNNLYLEDFHYYLLRYFWQDQFTLSIEDTRQIQSFLFELGCAAQMTQKEIICYGEKLSIKPAVMTKLRTSHIGLFYQSDQQGKNSVYTLTAFAIHQVWPLILEKVESSHSFDWLHKAHGDYRFLIMKYLLQSCGQQPDTKTILLTSLIESMTEWEYVHVIKKIKAWAIEQEYDVTEPLQAITRQTQTSFCKKKTKMAASDNQTYITM